MERTSNGGASSVIASLFSKEEEFVVWPKQGQTLKSLIQGNYPGDSRLEICGNLFPGPYECDPFVVKVLTAAKAITQEEAIREASVRGYLQPTYVQALQWGEAYPTEECKSSIVWPHVPQQLQYSDGPSTTGYGLKMVPHDLGRRLICWQSIGRFTPSRSSSKDAALKELENLIFVELAGTRFAFIEQSTPATPEEIHEARMA